MYLHDSYFPLNIDVALRYVAPITIEANPPKMSADITPTKFILSIGENKLYIPSVNSIAPGIKYAIPSIIV
jgi:hypothetical protein